MDEMIKDLLQIVDKLKIMDDPTASEHYIEALDDAVFLTKRYIRSLIKILEVIKSC